MNRKAKNSFSRISSNSNINNKDYHNRNKKKYIKLSKNRQKLKDKIEL